MAETDPISQTIRVMLVDAHTLVRTGVRLILERQASMTVVGEASNASEALEIAVQEKPNIILFEPNGNNQVNLSGLPDLIAAAGAGRVLLVTGITDRQFHEQAMQFGVMGIVVKDQPAHVLIHAIERVHAGEAWFSHSMMAGLVTNLGRERSQKNTDPEAEKIDTLSPREREVISLIGQGYKNREIAKTLHISNNTVGHHVTSILSKLGTEDRWELTIYAYQHGLAALPPGVTRQTDK